MRLIRPFAVGIVFATGACSNQSPTSPPPPAATPCAPAATVALAPLDGATVDCSAGTTFSVNGDGASYLLVAQFATGGVNAIAYTSHPFALGSPTATAAAAVPPAAALGPRRAANSLQTGFDQLLRQRNRDLARQAPRPAVGQIQSAPAVGDLRTFQVIANLSGTQWDTVTAALQYVGAHLYVFVDTLAPANGFSVPQLQGFSQLADQVLYQLDLDTFGQPTDIDQNGHVIMLLTPVVNALTPAAVCTTQGYVAGFFDGIDLVTDPHSNQGEIFYSIVPDPNGTKSCAHTVASVDAIVPATFLHEVQHMISFGQHAVAHGGNAEEGWLDEGLSLIAEELGARYYEAKFPPPTGRTNGNQLFPDSAEAFIAEKLVSSYEYLTVPDTVSLTLHSDDQGGLTWRGGDWLLMRYVGDQRGAAVYAMLDQSNLTGLANLSSAMALSFPQLFGNFAVALFTDSIVGMPRSSVPAQYRFSSRNLRQLYQAVFNGAQGQNGISQPFPIAARTLSPGTKLTGSMVPGTASFFRLTTAAGSGTVTLQFSTPDGQQLPASLHGQVSVFRLF